MVSIPRAAAQKKCHNIHRLTHFHTTWKTGSKGSDRISIQYIPHSRYVPLRVSTFGSGFLTSAAQIVAIGKASVCHFSIAERQQMNDASNLHNAPISCR